MRGKDEGRALLGKQQQVDFSSIFVFLASVPMSGMQQVSNECLSHMVGENGMSNAGS